MHAREILVVLVMKCIQDSKYDMLAQAYALGKLLVNMFVSHVMPVIRCFIAENWCG
jgi:hypothetical protein